MAVHRTAEAIEVNRCCEKIDAITNVWGARAALVFVDCQFWGKEGKMKGSTKSQKMDEPFSK